MAHGPALPSGGSLLLYVTAPACASRYALVSIAERVWRPRRRRRRKSKSGTSLALGWVLAGYSLGFLHLRFWKGVLAIVIWPYYLGAHFAH